MRAGPRPSSPLTAAPCPPPPGRTRPCGGYAGSKTEAAVQELLETLLKVP